MACDKNSKHNHHFSMYQRQVMWKMYQKNVVSEIWVSNVDKAKRNSTQCMLLPCFLSFAFPSYVLTTSTKKSIIHQDQDLTSLQEKSYFLAKLRNSQLWYIVRNLSKEKLMAEIKFIMIVVIFVYLAVVLWVKDAFNSLGISYPLQICTTM